MIPLENEKGGEEVKKESVAKKMKLIKMFKKLTCKKCSGDAYFIPTHNKVVCMKCDNIKVVDPSSLQPRDYMSDKTLEDFDAVPDGSRYAVSYQSPDSFALKDAPGRNETCSCGSGKKYKKCCLADAEKARNSEVLAMYVNQKNSALLAGANVVRMVNMAKANFDANPDMTEFDANSLGFKPFMNMDGELEDVNIFDVKVAN